MICWGRYEELLFLYQSLNEESITVKNIERIWNKMQSVCDDHNILAHAFLSVVNTLTHFTSDTAIMLKFIGIAKALATDVEDQRLKVDVCLKIATCYSVIGDTEQVDNTLLPLLNRHHGRLLQIFAKIFDNKIQLQYQKKLKFMLKHGLYFHTSYIVHAYVKSILDVFSMNSKYKTDAREMVSFLKEEPHGLMPNHPLVQENRHRIKLSIDVLLAKIEGRYEDAIAFLTDQLQSMTLKFGRSDDNCFGILRELLFCYVKFGDKKRATQTLKRMRRINKKHPDLPFWESILSSMKDSGQRSKTKVKATRCRCSNPYCNNVERKACEFSLCERCERVKYCSRKCQIKHWKSGHRENCKK